MTISYEKHPVTPSRKAQLLAQGFKIIDARFAPEGDAKNEVSPIPTKSEISSMKKTDCVDWLKAHGVDDPQGPVSDLRDVLRSVMYSDV